MNLDELRNVSVIKIESGPLWSGDCSRLLFDKTMPENLAAKVQGTYQAVSLSISGFVEHQKFLSSYKNVPEDLKDQCEHYSGLSVRLENDAVAWSRGATILQSRFGSLIRYPALFLTLERKNCPGCTIGFDPTHAVDLELYFVDWPFPKTNALRDQGLLLKKY